MNVTVCLIRVFPGYFLLPVLRQVVCWTEVFCIPKFFVDLPLENRYLKLFVMPDTLTGYLAEYRVIFRCKRFFSCKRV